MDIVDISNKEVHIGDGYRYLISSDLSQFENNGVDKIIFPRNGDPWVERGQFNGREVDEAVTSEATLLLDEAYDQKAVDEEEPTEEEKLELWRNTVEVTRFQGKMALDNAGLLDQIEAYMQQENTPKTEKMAWQDAGFLRRSAMVKAIGAEFGLTDTDLDNLFIEAEQIEV